ncbi:hypothetical protein FGO68_gene7542 [Halteria grandinella]|uniref:Uncharacterized protein n=1 Tax=Halteria grandinella TaxID=5974 RepID=A0A8J8NDB2_HALGN|nr:hypothetical protein FGO68_gene7542 [Halteria grandinella]
MHVAAITIQKHFKCYRWWKLYQLLKHRRLHAALKIQRRWRKDRFLRLLPKLRMQRREECAVMIQRYLRGYRVYRRSFKEVAQERIGNLTAYFSGMRWQLILDAQITIAYHWKRYLRKCQQVLIDEQRKKEEKEIKLKKRKTLVNSLTTQPKNLAKQPSLISKQQQPSNPHSTGSSLERGNATKLGSPNYKAKNNPPISLNLAPQTSVPPLPIRERSNSRKVQSKISKQTTTQAPPQIDVGTFSHATSWNNNQDNTPLFLDEKYLMPDSTPHNRGRVKEGMNDTLTQLTNMVQKIEERSQVREEKRKQSVVFKEEDNTIERILSQM